MRGHLGEILETFNDKQFHAVTANYEQTFHVVSLKAHTHRVIHDHVDHIFERAPVGMAY